MYLQILLILWVFQYLHEWRKISKIEVGNSIGVLFTTKTGPKNCPISKKFGEFLVWSMWILNTKFGQNRTIFRHFFGCETHTNRVTNLNFWYFSSLIEILKCPKYEQNLEVHSWRWFYTVKWDLGWVPILIRVGWKQNRCT